MKEKDNKASLQIPLIVGLSSNLKLILLKVVLHVLNF